MDKNSSDMEDKIFDIVTDLLRDDITKDEAIDKLLVFSNVSNWVAIESTEQPEKVTDVMVKYRDGVKEVALFDGDGRYYIEKDDRDVTDRIIEWHRLP